ncbi:alpha/beta fold hydrolase BchO [Fulvimarina sp. 2208YS6-2-32]|uniref:Alpha/beta fold hydrolase BchO n=1 Tax=Fulvimarina uroteuthidis TaxID=3098149 RepID=A0ABU5I140_9HYPH|nr:alpha/beta fold hydrolase BchO [Fulvimarina sp. 2208YS6-2-32]MDY8108473.1 alpha/beta fold hydrolase BchO [Fulvimarina sp. 2208YS6-2-32]
MMAGRGLPPADWPLVQHSRSVSAGGIDWHVQMLGDGPDILLIHGTGASTHSYRQLAPILARTHRVIMADCPGVGFSGRPERRPTLDEMARLHGALLRRLEASPRLIVGHSAGAVIAVQMALSNNARPDAIVSLGGALLPFPGRRGRLYPALAKLLFLNPVTPRLFAFRAHSERAVDQLLTATGSDLSSEARDYYARLFRDPRHVEGTLAMMSHWDLASFETRLARLETPLILVHGLRDKAIAPQNSRTVHERLPGSALFMLDGLGHLAHEEAPDAIAGIILGATGRAAPAVAAAPPSG